MREVPEFKNIDEAAKRRIEFIVFKNKFVDNPEKPIERKRIDDLDDFFERNKEALAFLISQWSQSEVTPPRESQKKKGVFTEESDIHPKFVNYILVEEGATVTVSKLHKIYIRFCKSENTGFLGRKKFIKTIKEIAPWRKITKNNQSFWKMKVEEITW